ncbi:titin-like [Diabrotica virgifera virgifera]|uniref:Titin-like n=1 Tax=Diabrotica virgifera virgifera TaxID=50390 RepID=A0ABM5L7A9_DIAVI|nr:titin-like [Diabrotica virgifera virgifera]
MLSGMQTSLLLFILLFAYSHTVKPPGYVEPQKTDGDPNPPKYEYGYNIVGDKGGEQGKQEQRDGIYASGRYFVQNKDARQDVQYFADDWGYHPAVEYANVGPHSQASAKFALGHEAVVQLRNKEANKPQLEGLPDTGPLKKDGVGSSPVPTHTIPAPILDQPKPQNTLLVPIPNQQPIVQQQEVPQVPYDPFREQSQPVSPAPNQQLIYHDQPKVQIQHQIEQPQPQIVYEQQEPQSVAQQDPSHYQQVVFEQPQIKQELPQPAQQLYIQHIPQPVENVIFPQPTPTPIIYQSQQPEEQQILIEQPQPNIVLLDQQKQEQLVAEKLVKSENQGNAFSYQEFGLKIKAKRPTKLIESTQHLVNGQDVLDINSAVTNYEEERIKSTTAYPTATEYTVTEPSLKEQPIVVADIDNKIVSSTQSILKEQEHIVSTTASSIESVSTTFESTSPTPTIVVTPRPVSTTFLAPITAGVRLESTEQGEEKYKLNKHNVQIEVQKTVPYYLGKYEYPLSQEGYYAANNSLVEQSVKNDLELGKTLLYFPGQLPAPQNQIFEIDNHINVQQLPNTFTHNQFAELDQQFAQGYQHQVVLQQLPTQQKEITKIIHQPYAVKVPYEVPVPIVKQVSVPVTVEKVIEKPVHITKIVEKPVPVPQPYPVEKIVDRPIHIPVQITKYVDRPYPVEVRVPYPQPYPVEKVVQKIVKQPYPVEVRVPVPVERIVEKKVPVPHYIEKPITVEKIVEKPVTKYVDRPYPVHIQVPVPTPVAVPVDRIVEKKVHVPQYIEKPVQVEKIVEKPVPQYIDRPYAVEVKVPVPQPYYVKVEVPRPYAVQVPVKFIEKPYYTFPLQNVNQWSYGGIAHNAQIKSNVKTQLHHQSLASHVQQKLQAINLHQLKDSQVHSGYANIKDAKLESSYSNLKDSQIQSSFSNVKVVDQSTSDGYHYPNPYAYAPQNNFYLPPKKEFVVSNEYLPPVNPNCEHPQVKGNDNYVGLLPPKIGQHLGRYLRKYRSARSNFDDKNIKMEYGFMPPMVPSLEIDEYGQPVEKGEKK